MASTASGEITQDRALAQATAHKLLIAVSGQETIAWGREVARAAPRAGLVRVLLVDDERATAFTSILPAARRRLAAAIGARRRETEQRRRGVLDALLPNLPPSTEIVSVTAAGDPGRAIAGHANGWAADVVMVGHDCRSRVERALTGSVHERVDRLARCAVLVVSAEPLDVTSIGRFARAAARGGA